MKKTIFLLLLILLFLFPNLHFSVGSEKLENSNILYDFVANADKATWKNAKTNFPFFGTRPGDISNNPVDSRGFACWRTNVMLEDNKTYSKVLETHPEWVDNGEISGKYPTITVPANSKLIVKFGFLKGATNSDGVVAKIFFDDSKTPVPIWGSDYKPYNGSLKSATVDLSSISGKVGSFILYVHTYKSSIQDWACWVDARIEYEEKKPDLIVTDIRTSQNRVYYKIKNIGDAPLFYTTPVPFTNTLYLDGTKVSDENLQINLNPNAEYESYFKNYNFVEPTSTYKLKVCTDTNNYIKESNENNNCLEKEFTVSYGGIKVDTGCPQVKVEIFDDKGVLVKSGVSDSYSIYSTGLTLIPGNYKVVPSKEGYTFDPKEKIVNVVKGQLAGVAFICTKIKKPDLIVEKIECNFEKKVINFTIANIGDEKTQFFFDVVLIIDGQLKETLKIEKVLNPNEKYSSSFIAYELQCTKLKVKVVVDDSKKIDEINENNNYLEKECSCELIDDIPPKILEGPIVKNITQNSAEVIWKTDEESDSNLFYDSKTGLFSKSSTDKNFVINHSLKLLNLKSGTIYEFYVQSKDRSGNGVKSGIKYFKTLEEDDKEKPNIDLVVPQRLLGTVNIVANVIDNKKVDRVVFYIDNIEVFTDYSFPYNFQLNSLNMIDGMHNISATAFDASGNVSMAVRETSIVNAIFDPIIKILEPHEGDQVYGDTNIKIRIDCPVLGCFEGAGVNKIEYYINNNLVFTETYSREVCSGTGIRRHCFTYPPASIPLEHQFSHNFTEANRENEIDTEIRVIAYYSNGKTGSTSINVKKRFTRREELIITREVNQMNNYYDVKIEIKNTGNVDYAKRCIKIIDYHCGFEVGTDIKFLKNNTNEEGWEFNFVRSNLLRERQRNINSNDPTLTMNFEKMLFSLRPNESLIINYKLIPVLFDQPDQFQHIIGCKPLEYYWGYYEQDPSTRAYCINCTDVYHELYFNKNNEFTSLTNNSDYLIVTNPVNLRSNTSFFDQVYYNNLLSTMAQLAIEKNGTLGYVVSSSANCADDYRHVFRNWGNQYLTSNWADNGYLLIVGEAEIVPTFIVSCWDGNYDSIDDTIHWTDSPYASTSGEDIHPEIFIGRIVGDDARRLIVPIETSLKVKNGLKEFCRNNSPCASAMVVSGVGNYQSNFTCTAQALCDDDEGDLGSEFQVYFLQGSSYHDDENENADTKRNRAFLENVRDRDVIVYIGHGYCPVNPNDFIGWANVITTNTTSSIDFGNSAPFLFASSCCTGRYAGIYGFPEAVFSRGAGIYIGATEITYGGCCCHSQFTNENELNNFFDAWLNHPNKTIAEAWRERRQDISNEWWFENSRFWSTVYQFYGDPKFDKR